MSNASCVLIVDDDPLVLLTAEACAHAAGLNAVAAHDGSEALRLVRDGLCPDLLVTDLDMPGLDGVELLDALRQVHGLDAVPTIMFSGEARPSRNGGADLWLCKSNPAMLEVAFREFAAAAARRPL